jgi:hypothetical protein
MSTPDPGISTIFSSFTRAIGWRLDRPGFPLLPRHRCGQAANGLRRARREDKAEPGKRIQTDDR